MFAPLDLPLKSLNHLGGGTTIYKVYRVCITEKGRVFEQLSLE